MGYSLLTAAGAALGFLAALSDASPSPALSKRIPGFELTGYTYSGCYYANIPPRLTVAVTLLDDSMTFEKCALACNSYTYFGLSLGQACNCGNAITPGAIPALDIDASNNACRTPCTGNSNQNCGGAGATTIFQKIGGGVVPPNSLFNPIGCYSQATAGVPLADVSFTLPAGLTREVCEGLCLAFRFFGLQNGNTCLCGNSIRDGARIQAPSSCNIQCSGNAAQTCGSNTNVNIYATPLLVECGRIGSDLRVKNPGFENGVAFWTATTSTPNTIQWRANAEANAVSGRRVARFSSKTTTAELTLSQPVSVCPGANYILSLYSREDAGSSCTARVTYNGVEEFATTSSASFTKFQSFLVSQSETTPLTITVRCTGSRTPFKVMYIDDVQLRPATSADVALFE